MNKILSDYFEQYPDKYIPIQRLIDRSNKIQKDRDDRFEKRKKELECLTSIRQMVSQKTL